MNRVIFIEGLPGTGKTTKAKTIVTELLKNSEKVCYMEEHHIENMIDITRKAFLSQEEYQELLSRCKKISSYPECKYTFEEIQEKISKYTILLDNIFIVSYSEIFFDDARLKEIILTLYKKEKCNGNCSFDEYKTIIYKMWEDFVKTAEENMIYVIDGGLLHNPMFDIIGYYNLKEEEIYNFYSEIYNKIKELKPRIIYLEMNNIEETIKQRRNAQWIESFSNWVEECRFGKSRHLRGMDGILKFCEEKMKIEEKIIKYLKNI